MDRSVLERFNDLRAFYNARCTRDIQFRHDSLIHLLEGLDRYSDELSNALQSDLGKSHKESYLTEIGFVKAEIRHHIKHLHQWSRPKRVGSPMALFPSKSRVIHEPKGVVLIIAPWNYPFHLAIAPLVGAISAGNCVAIKPSTTSSATCAVITKLIADIFPDNYVTVFNGNHDETAQLLECRFDHIFFTGGANFGRTVMVKAAERLIPTTLELGGKSPCIIDSNANLKVAALRIVWGKLINAGQTCIAPDYFFVHESVKDEFINQLEAAITKFYGNDIKNNPAYPRIISDKAFNRLTSYLSEGDIVYGGNYDASERYIEPTIIDHVTYDMAIMQDEIFGPIFPVIPFTAMEAVILHINNHEKPLALYYFGSKHKGRKVLSLTTSGGACINDVLMHIANPRLPFGGVGRSGTGRYHGYYSFETFSNIRGVVFSKRNTDIPLRYPPYKHFKLLKKIF